LGRVDTSNDFFKRSVSINACRQRALDIISEWLEFRSRTYERLSIDIIIILKLPVVLAGAAVEDAGGAPVVADTAEVDAGGAAVVDKGGTAVVVPGAGGQL